MSDPQRTPTVPVGVGLRSRVASAWSRRPLPRHLAQGALLLAIWLLAIGIGLQLRWYPSNVGNYVALGLVTAAAVALCRVAPLPGLIVVGLASGWPGWQFDVPELRVIPLVVAAFLSSAGGLRLWFAAPITAVFVVLTIVPPWVWEGGARAFDLLPYYFESLDPSTRILASIVVASALLLGNAVRMQRDTVATLRERNTELERLREADAARIAAEERTSLARDIHDVVAHHVSAMVIRAQAADRVADARPGELREAVRWIAGNGQEALTAMRQVVRVLRSDSDAPAPLEPNDFATALEAIVRRVRDTGLQVSESIEPGLVLTAVQQSTVVRILQEALTNVMLHSDAASARVSLIARGGALELRVDDDGSDDPRPAVSAHGGGSGIPGMRERAEAAGGSLLAGRLTGAGWTVLVRLPAHARAEAR